jgi:hypothetical protein
MVAPNLRKVLLILSTAILTFVIGVSAVLSLRSQPAAKMKTVVDNVSDSKSAMPRQEQWQTVTMEGKFTFQLPVGMKATTSLGDYSPSTFAEDFSNGSIQVTAGFSKSGKCIYTSHAQTSSVKINGETGRLAVDHTYEPALFITQICFRLVRSSKLRVWISVTHKHQNEQETVNRILNSIQFHRDS